MLFDEMNTDAALVPVFTCPLRIASASPTPFDQDSMSPWFTQSTHSVDTSASAQPSSMRVQVPPLGNDPQRRKSSSTSGSPRGAGMCRTPLGLQLGTPDLSRRSSVASSAAPPPLQSHISMVVPDHLYISSYRGASNAETVRQQHIGAFLCVAAEITSLPAHVDPFKVATGDIGFRHLRVEDDASCNVAAHLETAFAFIDEQNAIGRSVLLYCKAGKSRSATIAVAYLMREFGLSTLDALRTLQAVHPEADPNIFFLEQLKRWDEVRAR